MEVNDSRGAGGKSVHIRAARWYTGPMIISCSRREDIPAHRADFLLDALTQGRVLTRNPFNANQTREVSLLPEDVQGIVLWSKNPAPLLKEPLRSLLGRYAFYIQYTLNGYGPEIEPGVPPIAERLDTYRRLCDAFGPARVRWRYDPILLSPQDTIPAHLERFGGIALALEGSIDACTFSFMDVYRRILPAMKKLHMRPPDQAEQVTLARGLGSIAKERGIQLFTCCEAGDFAAWGIEQGACIDASLLESIAGRAVAAPKDPNQRPGCLCARAVDIGQYGACAHACRYCYARRADKLD